MFSLPCITAIDTLPYLSDTLGDVAGGQIDIHSGGVDLKFPHHENEIAQAEVRGQRVAARHTPTMLCLPAAALAPRLPTACANGAIIGCTAVT